MKKSIFSLAAAVLASFIPSAASATGFALYEQSTIAMGMAGSVVAGHEDASTLFYNPAGMSFRSGIDFQLTVTTYVGISDFTDTAGKKDLADVYPQPVPALFLNWKPLPWLAVGVGEFTVYGLGVKYRDDWSMNYDLITNDLQSFNVQPTVAFGPFKGFSVGLGFDIMYGSVYMKRALNFADGKLWFTELGGDGVGFGGTIGFQYEPVNWVRLGLVYRSRATIGTDSGRVHFSVPDQFKPMMKDQGISTDLTMPDFIAFGIRFRPVKGLEIEADVDWTNWDVWRRTVVRFEDKNMPPIILQNNWVNTFAAHLGAKYEWKMLKFMAGLMWDGNPVPDKYISPSLPDNQRVIWSAGFSGSFWKMHADISYMMVNIFPRHVVDSINAMKDGTFTTTVHNISLGLGGTF
jgi:long-chain fatty acid transport protein